jgi:hypothetical protein
MLSFYGIPAKGSSVAFAAALPFAEGSVVGHQLRADDPPELVLRRIGLAGARRSKYRGLNPEGLPSDHEAGDGVS